MARFFSGTYTRVALQPSEEFITKYEAVEPPAVNANQAVGTDQPTSVAKSNTSNKKSRNTENVNPAPTPVPKKIKNPENLLALWKTRSDKEADIVEIMKVPRFSNIGVKAVYRCTNHHSLHFFV